MHNQVPPVTMGEAMAALQQQQQQPTHGSLILRSQQHCFVTVNVSIHSSLVLLSCLFYCCMCLRLQKFDAGRSSPLLIHLLSSGKLPVQGKKAMVPGCG